MEHGPSSPLVCWDFDETLGYFRPLEFAWLGEAAPAGMPEPRLKPGIAELLASLGGFVHVVTTSAVAQYARSVLAARALLPYFADVLGREHGICVGEGKDYGAVGRRFGIAEDELARRLAIVGDDDGRDADARGRPILLVHDERMWEQPSEPLGILLRALAAEGGGDWTTGFERMRPRSAAPGLSMPQAILDGSVRFGIDYWGDLARGRAYPAISRPRWVGPERAVSGTFGGCAGQSGRPATRRQR